MSPSQILSRLVPTILPPFLRPYLMDFSNFSEAKKFKAFVPCILAFEINPYCTPPPPPRPCFTLWVCFSTPFSLNTLPTCLFAEQQFYFQSPLSSVGNRHTHHSDCSESTIHKISKKKIKRALKGYSHSF